MVKTVSAREFRNSMNKVIEVVQETGTPVTVIRNSKPWFVVNPIISEVEQGIAELDDPTRTKKHYNSSELFEELGI